MYDELGQLRRNKKYLDCHILQRKINNREQNERDKHMQMYERKRQLAMNQLKRKQKLEIDSFMKKIQSKEYELKRQKDKDMNGLKLKYRVVKKETYSKWANES